MEQLRQQHQQHQRQRQPHDQQAQPPQPALERGGRLVVREIGGNAAEAGLAAGGDDLHRRLARDHRGAGEQRIEGVGHLGGVAGARPLVDRPGLAGEDRFVDPRAPALEHDAVGRDEIARGEPDDIAAHQLLGGQ